MFLPKTFGDSAFRREGWTGFEIRWQGITLADTTLQLHPRTQRSAAAIMTSNHGAIPEMNSIINFNSTPRCVYKSHHLGNINMEVYILNLEAWC